MASEYGNQRLRRAAPEIVEDHVVVAVSCRAGERFLQLRVRTFEAAGGVNPPSQAPPTAVLSVTESTSLVVSLSPAEATLCSRCDTEPVPGISRIDGDRARSQASTICRGVAS
jgi:hypothetical protein